MQPRVPPTAESSPHWTTERQDAWFARFMAVMVALPIVIMLSYVALLWAVGRALESIA